MQVVKVFSGDDGESHFEDLTPDGLEKLLERLDDAPLKLNRIPPDLDMDYHPAPRLQLVVNLSGGVEYGTADGGKRRLGTGDILVATDLTGRGHTMRNGSETRYAINIPLRP